MRFLISFILLLSIHAFADEATLITKYLQDTHTRFNSSARLSVSEVEALVQHFENPKEHSDRLMGEYWALVRFDFDHSDTTFALEACIRYIQNYSPNMFEKVTDGDPILREVGNHLIDFYTKKLFPRLIVAFANAPDEAVEDFVVLMAKDTEYHSQTHATYGKGFLLALTNRSGGKDPSLDPEAVFRIASVILKKYDALLASAPNLILQIQYSKEKKEVLLQAAEFFQEANLPFHFKTFMNQIPEIDLFIQEMEKDKLRQEEQNVAFREREDLDSSVKAVMSRITNNSIPIDGAHYKIKTKRITHTDRKDNIYQFGLTEELYVIDVLQAGKTTSHGIAVVADSLFRQGANGIYFEAILNIPAEFKNNPQYIISSYNDHFILRNAESSANPKRERKVVAEPKEFQEVPVAKPVEKQIPNVSIRASTPPISELRPSIVAAMKSSQPSHVYSEGAVFEVAQVKIIQTIPDKDGIFHIWDKREQILYTIKLVSSHENPAPAYMSVVRELFDQGAKGIYFADALNIPNNMLSNDPAFQLYKWGRKVYSTPSQ